jgi:hypothetical protein
LEFKSEGILHQPFKFRKLEFSAQTLERDKFTEIGTKFGTPIYPYFKQGLYYNFKSHRNPIATYKGSTPHLYLSRHTGWRLRSLFDSSYDRGLSIPINIQKAESVNITSVQMWIRYSEHVLPTSDTPIFSIDHKNGIYDFKIKSDESAERARIFGVDRETGQPLEGVTYYINGNPTNEPFLLREEWYAISVSFQNLLDFSLYTGRINLNGPLTYNNISYYDANSLQKEQIFSYDKWVHIEENYTWGTLDNDTWENSFITQSTAVKLENQGEIYSRYVGSNRIIIDHDSDGIIVDPDAMRVISDVSWSGSVGSAV